MLRPRLPAALRACRRAYWDCAPLVDVSAAPRLKVYYPDMAFWRAECVRLALFLGDVEFEDVRDPAQLEALRRSGQLPSGQLPAMQTAGGLLTQTQAMATYASKLAKIAPDDALAQARVDEAINGATDVTVTLGATFRLPDAEKPQARAALTAADGRLTRQLDGLCALLRNNGDCGRVVGESLTVADLALWRLRGWLHSGRVDHVEPRYVARFAELGRLHDRVEAEPRVQAWKQLHPRCYA